MAAPPPDPVDGTGPRLPWGLIGFVLLLGVAVAGTQAVDTRELLNAVREWVRGQGAWGPVLYGAAYVAATVAGVPGTPWTVSAGLLFDPATALATMIAGSTLSATGGFLVARYAARDRVEAWLDRTRFGRRLDRLNDLLDRHGPVAAALVRLLPLHFLLLNLSFGLTRIGLGTYVVWSSIGMIPMNVLYVLGGDAFFRALTEGRIPWLELGAIAAMAVVAGVLFRFARRRLGRHVQ